MNSLCECLEFNMMHRGLEDNLQEFFFPLVDCHSRLPGICSNRQK